MAKKIFIGIVIFFCAWAIIGFAVFFPPLAIIPVLIIAAVFYFSGKKEDVMERNRKMGEAARNHVDKIGSAGTELSKTVASAAVWTGRAVSGAIEEGYKKMGGEKGVQEAMQKVGNFTAEVGKAGVNLKIAAGQAMEEIAEYSTKRHEEANRHKLMDAGRKLLGEFVNYKIMGDN